MVLSVISVIDFRSADLEKYCYSSTVCLLVEQACIEMSMYKNVCFTSRAHVQLLLQDLVLAPEESHLIGQLTLLVVAVDEDVGGC